MYEELKTISVGTELICDCKAYSSVQLNIPNSIKKKLNVEKDMILRVAFLGVVKQNIEKEFIPAENFETEEKKWKA